jgi:capsular exopolysaccharide synthesis family protein
MFAERANPSDSRLVTLVNPRSFEADQFRRLRHRVEELADARNLRVIAVTSAVASDGKTLVSINLAGALARGTRVLLVDADLRRPSIATTLGLPPGRVDLIAAVRAATPQLGPYVRRIPGSSLDVLTTDTVIDDPYEMLTSHAFAAVLARARESYDLVIVDTAPVLPVPDTGLLRRVVDGYVVVVSANATPRKLLGEALNSLDPSSVMGLVFNRDDFPLFGYYGGYKAYFHDYTHADRRSA